tara:strand:- start:3475 stop:3819 length:345 start_codon:yes stop_codon:yes gene_type:complete
MQHQDWNNIVLNTNSQKIKAQENKEALKSISQKQNNVENSRLEAPKQLGQLISQARTTKGKTQKQLANELKISQQVYSRWESNKEIPTNAQIANIEKNLAIKLPRCKKVAAKDI